MMLPLLVMLLAVGRLALASAAMAVAPWPTLIVPELTTVLSMPTAMP